MGKKKSKAGVQPRKIRLLDLSARSEHTSVVEEGLDKGKTTWIVGMLSNRQTTKLVEKHSDKISGVNFASMAFDFAKYGLKDVKGPLSKNFKLVEDYTLGYECEAVCSDFLDVLPPDLTIEIGNWVGELAKVNSEGKDVS